MKKPYSLIPAVLGALLLAGCGGTAATIDSSVSQKSDSPASTQIDSSNKDQATDTHANKEKENKQQNHTGKKNTSKANQDKPKAQDSQKVNDQTASGQKNNQTSEEPEGSKKAEEPKPTYQAIQPPKDAKPLKTKYSKDILQKMPSEEAHGGSRKRTVPFGQTLLKGKKDLTNGPLKKHRLVAFYGTPKSSRMGVLGQYPPDEMMEKLKKQAAAYSKVDPAHPAIPTIELIATVAQRNPGPDGNYVAVTSSDTIKKYAELAKKNNALLLLDIQLGRASVMHGVKAMAPYLKLPYVHLAIDTEYSVEKGEVPGEDLGHVDGSEIQEAVEYVNQLVEKNNLPDKLVVVHQFGDSIIKHKNLIKPTQHVEIALNYDGFGLSAVKMAAYGQMVRKEPIQYGGFKLFYDLDKPLMSPKDVLKLDPAPAIINYE